MPQRLLVTAAWIGIALLAATLRFPNLNDRPLHADEATGARMLAGRVESNQYAFNPQHFHGPLLSLTSLPIARARGDGDWKSLSKTTLRLGPAISGMALVFTPLFWARRFGQIPALAASAFLATSPLLVYYNRTYIHESLLGLLALLSLGFLVRLVEKPSLLQGSLSGIGIGLMFCTKETFAISLTCWAAASAICLGLKPKSSTAQLTQFAKPIGLAVAAFILTSISIYSNGFTSAQGVMDSVRTFTSYQTSGGHDKPLMYYAHLLIWPKRAAGVWWSEATIAILCVFAIARHRQSKPVLFIALSTLANVGVYSLISYKTPWLMLVPWAHACLLAGFALHCPSTLRPTTRYALMVLVVAGLFYQTRQSIHASGRLSSDARNPYAYVPTSKDLETLEHWLAALREQCGQEKLEPVAVSGSQYWPLPWYLRQFETIGYWPVATTELQRHPIVFSMPDQMAATSALLQDSHTSLPRSLRNEVPLMLYLRNDIWEQWTETPQQ